MTQPVKNKDVFCLVHGPSEIENKFHGVKIMQGVRHKAQGIR